MRFRTIVLSDSWQFGRSWSQFPSRPVRAPLYRTSGMAGRSVARIGRDRRADLRVDDHLPGRSWPGGGHRAGARELVAAYPRAAGFSSADSAHQAPAPGAQPFHGISGAARVSARIPPLQGDEDFGLDTGKDVTRIDALQAFSCVECGRCTEHCPAYNYRQDAQPQGNRAGTARLSERVRRTRRTRRCWARTFPKRPFSSAPPAAPASISARWAFSTCP